MISFIRRTLVWTAVVSFVWASGCSTSIPLPPRNITQYRSMPPRGPGNYPRRTIVLYNLQRTMNPDLGEFQRVSSLRVVLEVGVEDLEVWENLNLLIDDATLPPSLEQEIYGAILFLPDEPLLASRD